MEEFFCRMEFIIVGALTLAAVLGCYWYWSRGRRRGRRPDTIHFSDFPVRDNESSSESLHCDGFLIMIPNGALVYRRDVGIGNSYSIDSDHDIVLVKLTQTIYFDRNSVIDTILLEGYWPLPSRMFKVCRMTYIVHKAALTSAPPWANVSSSSWTHPSSWASSSSSSWTSPSNLASSSSSSSSLALPWASINRNRRGKRRKKSKKSK